MALQLNIELNNGITVPTSYARIKCIIISHTKRRNIEMIDLEIYNNKDSYDNDKEPIMDLKFTRPYDDTMTTSFADIYTYLKTLPEFAGATDV